MELELARPHVVGPIVSDLDRGVANRGVTARGETFLERHRTGVERVDADVDGSVDAGIHHVVRIGPCIGGRGIVTARHGEGQDEHRESHALMLAQIRYTPSITPGGSLG